jgi:hypothetical protein
MLIAGIVIYDSFYFFDIMKAYGVSLTVESEKGEGSTFYARLPDVKSLAIIADHQEVQRDIIKEQLR